ncbi:MAG TPA: hypothetical protein ENH34_04515 [Phycisphaerales bacterium]|nr:hypothetical protein [Phycisphaerales bacterium]
MKENNRKRDIVKSFFSNPLGILSLFIGLIGIVLAIYFHNAARENRKLRLYLNQATNIIVKSGETSNLSVSFKGERVTSDVTARQVAIWNAGKKSIKLNNILKPVVLNTGGCQILEANVMKESREGIVNTKLDASEFESGNMGISWDILEEDDGCIIQLIYAGGPDIPIEVKGVIEGQKNLSIIRSAPRKSKFDYRRDQLLFSTSGCIMVGFCIFTFYSIAKHGDFATITKAKSAIPAVIMALMIGIVGVLSLFQLVKIEPPLPF